MVPDPSGTAHPQTDAGLDTGLEAVRDTGLGAAALDAADPLAGFRDHFVGAADDLVYFDGNSLGRPLAVTAERMTEFVTGEWGGRLIRGWDEHWLQRPLALGDRIGAGVVGAAADQVALGDSTTVWLYKLLRAAVDGRRAQDPARTEIVLDTDNFPTDRYVAEGIAAERGLTLRWIEADPATGVTPDQVAQVVGERTAVVLLSHVAYRSAWVLDAAAVTRIAHDAGALVLLDLCHSAGAVEVELDAWGVDLAVGCSYKYLNGGPGAPAFGYVARRHQETLRQPIQGWMGHADPFLMGPGFAPGAGIRGFVSGTMPVMGMLALPDMLDLVEAAGMPAIRAKSVALTSFTIDWAEQHLADLGVRVASPRDPARRGGHVTLTHPAMREVVATLWQRDVIPDYRDPGGLRIGLSPLSTSFTEVETGMQAVREVLEGLA